MTAKTAFFSGTISSINHPVFPHVREMELVRRGEEDLSPYILHQTKLNLSCHCVRHHCLNIHLAVSRSLLILLLGVNILPWYYCQYTSKHSPTMLGVWLLGSIQSTYHLTSWDLLTQPACLGMVPAFLTTRSKTAVGDSILIIGDSSFTPEPCSVMSHSLLFAICHYVSCKQSHTAAGAIANISYIFQTEPESQVLFLLGNVAYLFQNLVAKQPPTRPGYNGM